MGKPSRAFKVGSVMWSVLISICVLALGASIMLPSTKRARFNFQEVQQMRLEEKAARAAAEAATRPTSGPSTQPGSSEAVIEN